MKKNIFLTTFLTIFFIIAFCFGFYPCSASAASNLQKAQVSSFINKIPEFNSISCKFKQEKIIKGSTKPLISGGNFKFIKEKGVYFETLYPIKSTVSYTNKEYKQINDIITAISNKKYKALEESFDFYFAKENSDWVLLLKPKTSAQAGKYISSIQIEGEDTVKKIIIISKDGSKTTQWFQK